MLPDPRAIQNIQAENNHLKGELNRLSNIIRSV